MTNIWIIMAVLILFGVNACQKVDKTTISPNPAASVLAMEDGKVIVLQEADKDVPIVYTWSAANFGPDLVTTYTLQMAKQGDTFANPISLGVITHLTELSMLTSELNNKLLPLLANPAVPQPLPLEFRVKASVSTNVDPVYSAVIKQTITPYYVPIIYPVLNVPGSYQGWNPADSTTAIFAPDGLNPDKYEGYIMFTDNTEFKYAKGSWDLNWGDDNADGTLDPGGANIICATGGYYKLNVDLVALTHSFMKTDWGLIGSATPGGWDNDTDMTYDEATRTWKVTLDLVAGDIKFRANDSWDLNYGDNAGNGTLQKDGANIPVAEAGNYTITLDLSKAIYTYTVKAN